MTLNENVNIRRIGYTKESMEFNSFSFCYCTIFRLLNEWQNRALSIRIKTHFEEIKIVL